MTPGAILDLQNRIQALEAQVRRTASTTTTTAANGSTATTTTVQGLTPSIFSTPQSWTKAAGTLTLDNAWHTLSPTGIPASCLWLIVDGYVRNDGSPDTDKELDFRSSSLATNVLRAARVSGQAGNYSGSQAFQVLVPCTDSQTFDYRFSASLALAEIRVIGYWS